MELVRVRQLAVAAAAACCSFSDYENPPPQNAARVIRREGRRAVSAQLAGRVVITRGIIFWPWVGPFCEYISHMFRTNRVVILTPSIALDTIVRILLFSGRRSHCSSRGGVAAEGTSCMLGTKKCTSVPYKFQISITFSDP